MSQDQNGPSNRSLTFEESVKYLRDFIAKMLESNGRLRVEEENALSNAQSAGDIRHQHISGLAISSYQNDQALYMIVSYLLDILETQALVNQQLLSHINRIAAKPIYLPPATIGEIVKSGLDQLAKAAEEKARKLPPFLYT